MCDCEELELEDFETILTAISKASPTPGTQAPLEVPMIRTSRKQAK